MKHEVSRKKTAAPPSRVKISDAVPTQKKAVKDKKIGAKTAGKSVSPKLKPTAAVKNTKPKTVASKKANPAKPVSDRKNASPVKAKGSASKLSVTAKTNQKALKTGEKPLTNSASKTKPATAPKQKSAVKNDSVKVKTKTVELIEKPKSQKSATKNPAVKPAQKLTATAASDSKSGKTKTIDPAAKTAKAKAVKSNKITGKDLKKPTAAAIKKATVPTIKKIVTAKKSAPKPLKLKPAAGKKISAKVQTGKPAAKLKNIGRKIEKTTAKKKMAATTEKNMRSPKSETVQTAKRQASPKSLKTAALPTAKIVKSKARQIEQKKSVKIRNGRLVLPPLKKIKPVETRVETIVAPTPPPRLRKPKPFGAAIFRGAKTRYDFQVFPAEFEFEDAAAIFVISQRTVDKKMRAHHKMVCIGQTDSILSELKKHRKGKCFKHFRANAVSVLREENEQKRLKIEADLKSAHQIPCSHE